MGTVFSFELRDRRTAPGTLDRVLAWLHWVDEVFSTYRPDSEISRLATGELTVAACAPEVAEVLELCAQAQTGSGGWFSVMPAGRLEPSGMVKGWSIERAHRMLVDGGSRAHAVNGGGDVRCHGTLDPDDPSGDPWQVGVADPLQRGELLAVVRGPWAVATSGTAERGGHVLDPYTGRPADQLASVTLVGPDMTWVDAWATAALAMGPRCRDWINGLAEVEGLVVGLDGEEWRSARWAQRTADPRA